MDFILLKLLKKNPGDSSKGWSAEYKFQIQVHDSNQRIGHINLRLEDNDEGMNYIGHIGYSVIKAHRGHKYSVKACYLLKKSDERPPDKPCNYNMQSGKLCL
jgi:tagatose 1,6-diphosphate aldolase